MITFQTISYKNFLSCGNVPITINLENYSTNLISGKNGSGKSSVIDAIFFALYGKPYRNITKPGLVNSINSSDCEVCLEFKIGSKQYKIVRGIKPNLFEIYENGSLIQQSAAVKDYQIFLETNILNGISEKIFKQVVVISSVDYKPFMQLSTSARREVVEDLLDLNIFSSMSAILKGKLTLIKEVDKDTQFGLKLVDDRKQIFESEKSKTEQEKKKLDSEVSTKLIELESNLTKIELKAQEHLQAKVKLEQKLVEKSKTEQEKHKLLDLQRTESIEIQNIQKMLTLFEKNCSCPTCTRDLDTSFKDSMSKTLSDKKCIHEKEIATLKTQLTAVESKLDEFNKIQTTIQTATQELSKLELLKSKLETQKTFLKTSNVNYDKKIEEFKEKLADCEAEIVKLKDKLKQLTEDKKYVEIVLDLLKDGGIKIKIVKQYIPIMNKLINEYLVRFGLPIEFNFDEQFNEVLKSRYRDTFVYNNFSEGEKQRIDLALLLTWRQIAKLKNTVNCNLLFFDETFDSSLDQTATEELLNILLNLKDGSNVFVISHKADLSDKMQATYEFEKQGNFTQMKVKT